MKTDLEKNEHESEIYATGERLFSVCCHTFSCPKFKTLQTKLKMPMKTELEKNEHES